MSDKFSSMFRLNVVINLFFGMLLLLFPGRFLGATGWAPVDPILTRVLGAALLAFAWGTFQAMRNGSRIVARFVIELQAIFYILAGFGTLRQLLLVPYPMEVWGVFGMLMVLGLAWGVFWLNEHGLVVE